MQIKYTDDFKRRVMSAFDADDFRLKELLDNNAEIVGRILDDSRQLPFEASEILELMEKDPGRLKAKAQQVEMRKRLYHEWNTQYGGRRK